eukprot:m.307428 g.307428  ORF g.307428 m.307428 type:complete len:417 (+) comp19946_c0_seq1:2-1252(+)
MRIARKSATLQYRGLRWASVRACDADRAAAPPHGRKTQHLPDLLQRRTAALLRQHGLAARELRQYAARFTDFLNGRRIPGIAPPAPPPGVVRAKQLFDNRLDYRLPEALTFAGSRLPAAHAAAVAALDEVRQRLATLAPVSLLDVGSGIGTATWACNTVFPDSLKEVIAVDVSRDMHAVAQQLFSGEGLDEEGSPFSHPIEFRHILPQTHELKFDIVFGGHLLTELPDVPLRHTMIRDLWAKTGGALVLTEMGNPEGFATILEARDLLIEEGAHVIAPCAHAAECPRANDTVRPCHFPVRVGHTDVMAHNAHLRAYGFKVEKFCYLVVAREPSALRSLPRIVSTPVKRGKHIHFTTCHPDGDLRRITVAKSVGKEAWRDSKARVWGDVLPVEHKPNANRSRDDHDDNSTHDGNHDE